MYHKKNKEEDLMTYPEFFNRIESITLQDELANFLGVAQEGILEFNYIDIVKSAGHSCPTVLGAYLMTKEALKALYKEELPKRGEIKVLYKESSTDGVAGVIANVMTNILGATTNFGFKGIAGNFDRRHLMFFEQDINSNVRFIRRDTKQSVDVYYDASVIIPHEEMPSLMQKCMSKTATKEEQEKFGQLWQKRVEDIASNIEKTIKVVTVED
jgi:hypothetical protein